MNAPTLYPERRPLRSFVLPVDGGHGLHVDEWGRPDGVPALLLHGGPGSGCSPFLRRFFDPERYRVICPDQRGAGRSTPAGSIAHNTTPHLLADLRTLRAVLGISQWLVVGGSWGATLALAHGLDQPQAVSGLLLRSTFLARPNDIDGFFKGAPAALAEQWRGLAGLGGHQLRALTRLWTDWEHRMNGGEAPPRLLNARELDVQIARLRVQSHYLSHGCWLQQPPLLERCAALPRVPTLLLHGSDDRVCQPLGAQALHAEIPGSALDWVESAGHDPSHPAMVQKMVHALDRFAAHKTFRAMEPDRA